MANASPDDGCKWRGGWPDEFVPSDLQCIPHSHNDPPACVPRRFGIGTLLVVSTAYALLFWLLQAVRLPTALIIGVAAFLFVVGVVQMFAGPENARPASTLTGSLLFTIYGLGAAIVDDPSDLSIVFAILFCGVIGGGALGYVAGALVAGVFLIMQAADGLVDRFSQKDAASPEASSSDAAVHIKRDELPGG